MSRVPPRATVRSQIAVGLASLAAPMLVALPALMTLELAAWPTIFGLALVTTVIAAVLLIGVTPTPDREIPEVGLIWVFAGAGSALAFTGPVDSCLVSPQSDVMLGAAGGTIAWPCFVVLRRMLDHLLPGDASQP